MTREERNTKLKHFITCLKCEVGGIGCNDNCPVQYGAGNMGEIIENLEAISKALEQQTGTCEDFIQYAKEHYGIDIEFKDSDKPDTFNGLFGVEVYEDAVSRQAAIDALKQAYWNKDMQNAKDDPCIVDAMTDWAIRTIKDLPPVNPQLKVGHWVLLDECSNSEYYCSECYKKLVKEGWSGTVKKINYCPNCGAKIVDKEVSDEKSNNFLH